jgi:hypothetical protein
MLTVSVRKLINDDAEIVVAFGAFSVDVAGHRGRYIARPTASQRVLSNRCVKRRAAIIEGMLEGVSGGPG